MGETDKARRGATRPPEIKEFGVADSAEDVLLFTTVPAKKLVAGVPAGAAEESYGDTGCLSKRGGR